MRIAWQWTVALMGAVVCVVLVAGVWLHVQWGAQADTADAAWRSARLRELQDQLAAFGSRTHAAAVDVAGSEDIVAGLGPLLVPQALEAAALPRGVVDWAPRHVAQFALDELSVLDAAGRVITSAWSPASYGQVPPLAGAWRSARREDTLLWRAAANPRRAEAWMVGAAVPWRVAGRDFTVIAGRSLDERACARLADLAGIQSVRIAPAGTAGEPAAGGAFERPVPLPENWRLAAGDAGASPLLWAAVGASPAAAPLQALRRRLWTGGAVLMLLVALGAPLLARRLARPLEQLTEGVRAAAASSSSAAARELAVTGPAEVRALGRAVRELSQALEHTRTRAVAAERRNAWREIARRIAHELKNALSPLSLALDNIETATVGGLDRPQARSAFNASLTAARDQIHSLDRLVTEFREFARAPALHLAEADARALCASALAGVRQAHPETSFVMATTEDPGALRADAEQLRRALHNLLANAAEAQPGGRVELSYGSGPGPDRWWVAVRDEGPGLPAQIAARLGEPYLTTKDRGTGLGLAIVLQIAEAHGGVLEARPKSPRGLEMRLTLARAPLAVGVGQEGTS